MSIKTLNLTENLYQYLLAHSLREPKILQELRRETAQLPGARMQISPEQGQFMALLIEIIGAKKTLEIGVYTGYSTLSVALALPKDGSIIACDIDEDSPRIAQKYWQKAGVAEKITLHIAPALKTLDELIANNEQNSFDFVFIDADKNNYLAYYEKALILLRRGGLVAIDNTLWSGDVADDAINDPSTVAIRELNKKLHEDERISMSLIPIGDGLTLGRKK